MTKPINDPVQLLHVVIMMNAVLLIAVANQIESVVLSLGILAGAGFLFCLILYRNYEYRKGQGDQA